MVDLLEDHLVAERMLVQVALDHRIERRAMRERLPRHRGRAFAAHAEERDRARVVMRVVQLVHGDVREQAAFGVGAARGQAAAAAHEHPQIGVARNAHQERRKTVEVRDAKELLTREGNQTTVARLEAARTVQQTHLLSSRCIASFGVRSAR
ncbi:MAG: hypothetical protein IPJ04_01145 [Candidatus Eisenbacteria bacterium]|nr:hypothetical protein [Candidatus Eisenbacteria bacterium]